VTRSVGTGRGRDRIVEERILPAAERLFAAKGFHETSMQDIAAAAEVSRPRIYMSYRSKDALFAASLKDAMSKLLDWEEASATRDYEWAQFDRILSFVQRLSEDPTPWVLYLRATTIPEFGEQVDEIRQVVVEKLTSEEFDPLQISNRDPSASVTAESVLRAVEAVGNTVVGSERDTSTLMNQLSDLALKLEQATSSGIAAQSGSGDLADDSESLRNLLERARVGIADGWAEAIDKYGVVGAAHISEMSHADRVATEQELLRQARNGQLIGLTVEGVADGGRAVVFPAFQFGEDGAVLPVMSDIASRVADRWDVETRLLWLTSPNGWLGAQAPADLLATQPEAVLRALDLAMNAA
jgi:AcrR family transcriptional regulator